MTRSIYRWFNEFIIVQKAAQNRLPKTKQTVVTTTRAWSNKMIRYTIESCSMEVEIRKGMDDTLDASTYKRSEMLLFAFRSIG